MNRLLTGLALMTVTLTSAVARADHDFDRDDRGGRDDRHRTEQRWDRVDHHATAVNRWNQHSQWNQANQQVRYDARTGQYGSYQLQNVQTLVAAQQRQVWVEGHCAQPVYGQVVTPRFCTAGHYRTEWVPSHYETTQQWVWVASAATGQGCGSGAGYQTY